MSDSRSSFASSGPAQIYFETAGSGSNLVLIHAGVADSRQWNAAFDYFQASHRVLRYDMRGYGRSEPVAGSYRALDDLQAVVDAAEMSGPKVLLGCSMGGTLAMDYTLTHPGAVSALIMVCSGPSGLSLDVDEPAKFAEVEQAEAAGDLDRVCELETQIWFDGCGRESNAVEPQSRALLYTMNRLALEQASRNLGTREFDVAPAAYKRLAEIEVPVMILTGGLDIPYMAAAAEFMRNEMPHAHTVTFSDSAHLPNMEHPDRFNECVHRFLDGL